MNSGRPDLDLLKRMPQVLRDTGHDLLKRMPQVLRDTGHDLLKRMPQVLRDTGHGVQSNIVFIMKIKIK